MPEHLFAGAMFDAVVASEVIEHISNVPEFCASLVALTKPGGSLVISTINRTSRSYAVAIIGAEQILGLLPEGTHQWERFITPGMGFEAGASCSIMLKALCWCLRRGRACTPCYQLPMFQA